MKALAASAVVIPASLSSFDSRSCSVWKARSDRPRACEELDAQLRQRPADLGEMAAVDLARLGGAEIVRASIRERLIGRPGSEKTSFSARKVEAVPSSS